MKHILIILFSIQSLSNIGQITLNEMQSSNNSTIADNVGDYDDWIELHNPTNTSVEIGGLILKDQLDTWAIPTGDPSTLIPPGGFFLLWADDEEPQGIFHTNFKLASGGEFLGLYESDGVSVIDSLTIPALNSNDSYMRCESGWSQTSSPTPLISNDCSVGIDENLEFDSLFRIDTNYDGHLEVQVLETAEHQYHLSLYSITGQEILRGTIQKGRTRLSMPNLEGGYYLVSIAGTKSIYSKKMNIQ